MYKTSVMIELSTLTGAILISLGSRFAGMFGNDSDLKADFKQAGKESNEEVWEMPVEDYHRELVRPPYADLTNSSGKTEAHSSQAAAFLNVKIIFIKAFRRGRSQMDTPRRIWSLRC